MRKIARKVLSLCMAVAMVAGMATTAFAMETVNINGYPDYTVGEDVVTAEYQISISNVIKKDTTKYLAWADTYICQGPVTVTALDNLKFFGGATLIPHEDTYIEGTFLSVKGNAVFYDGTVKNYDANAEWAFGEDFYFQKGSSITITEPGIYHINGCYEALAGGADVVLVVQEGSDSVSTSDTTATPTPAATANPTNSKVTVNGKAVAFDAYNINNNNYFKLRDIAQIISGTEKQFNVTWDGSKNAINLISNEAYKTVGGEFTAGDGTSKEATTNTSVIYMDGVSVDLTAYTINDNNYFKLRDLGKTFNFNVTWDSVNNTVVIDTTQDYIEE
ncbi:MAG: hypothetical protein AB7D36_05260 [Oscillospiraceae bacterium]